MRILTLYSDKGGVSKTTSAPNLAASLKNMQPGARVGLMDACSDHGHLSKRYAAKNEQEFRGVWDIVENLLNPRTVRDTTQVDEAVRNATTLIRVIPDSVGTDGCVFFLNVCVSLSHNWRGASVFASMDSARKFGETFTDAIERVLQLDYLIVDLPGMVEDAMVRSILPHCYAAAIPVDMRSYMNLAESGILVTKLKELQVYPSGFLRTFIEEGDMVPAAQRVAEQMLVQTAASTHVPIFPGGIPNKTTLVTAIEPVEADDHGPDLVGLYCMAARKGLNSNQRGVIERAMAAMDGALVAMLEEPAETPAQ
jgi:cellulose biosynthesis protein BcsQ